MTSRTPLNDASASPAPARRMVHIPALDGLRGLAILLVLVFHFSSNEWNLPLSGWFKYAHRAAATGWAGVDLFFVLSGFLITSILFEAKQSAGYFKNFYMRRVLRIFPLYYGVLFVALIAIPLVYTYRNVIYTRVVAHQFWLWVYFQNYVRPEKAGWAGFTHFWSLAVEEQFYLVWPAVVWLLGRRTLLGVCVGMIGTALVMRCALVMAGVDPQSLYYWTPCRMDALAIGAFIALASRGPRGLAALVRPAAFVAGGTGLLLAGLFVFRRGTLYFKDPLVQTAGYSLLALFFGSLLVKTVASRPDHAWGRLWSNRGLRFFGKYSYGIYVFHGLLVLPVAQLLRWPKVEHLFGLAGRTWLVLSAQVVVGSVLSTACALASWHLYEKHFLKLKRFFEYRASTLGNPVRDAVVPSAVKTGGSSPTAESVEVFPSMVDATRGASPAQQTV